MTDMVHPHTGHVQVTQSYDESICLTTTILPPSNMNAALSHVISCRYATTPILASTCTHSQAHIGQGLYGQWLAAGDIP